jgi:hypothetical protein
VGVRERRDERGGHRARVGREPDPERAALVGRLDDDREPQPLLDRRQRVRGAELLERRLAEREEVRSRDARIAHRVLGNDLVGAAHARADPAARVRDPDDLEELLDGAVLAVAAVQADERRVGRRLA